MAPEVKIEKRPAADVSHRKTEERKNAIPELARHPLCDLYQQLLTARLNVLCLQDDLRTWKFLDYLSEIIIALATTSAVGSFWFLQTPSGAVVWRALGALAVIFSIIRPILKFGDKIQSKQKLLSGYSVFAHQLECLTIEVDQAGKYDNELHRHFLKLMSEKTKLVEEFVPRKSKARRATFEAEVLKEWPFNDAYAQRLLRPAEVVLPDPRSLPAPPPPRTPPPEGTPPPPPVPPPPPQLVPMLARDYVEPSEPWPLPLSN